VQATSHEGLNRWSPEKRALVGIGGIVVVELLAWAMRLRRHAAGSLHLRLQDWDSSTRTGFRRSEVGMFIAGLSGARRHAR
jgi:hypothetical protein